MAAKEFQEKGIFIEDVFEMADRKYQDVVYQQEFSKLLKKLLPKFSDGWI